MVYFPTVIFYFVFIFTAGFGLIFGANDDLYLSYLKKDPSFSAVENQAEKPKISAQSALLIDNESGQVIFEKNATTSRPIASLTKLMTTLVFLEAGQDLNQEIEIKEADYRAGNQIFLTVGDKVKKNDLVNLAIIASSNEAAAAMANNSGVEDFISLMNKKAEKLSLKQTKFFDPTGLEPKNISSVWDLYYLSQNAFLKSEINTAAKKPVYQFINQNNLTVSASSTNKFLTAEKNDKFKILAAKTGYLQEAGYCLALWFENKYLKNQTLILLGSETETLRWQDAQTVIEWAQSNINNKNN